MRNAAIKRKTNETDILVELDLDGEGRYSIETGIGFLDHMLGLFARHGLFDLKISCLGDLDVDTHHTVEDVGIALGQSISSALSEKAGISRYGSSKVPMDEALADVTLDISGRAYLVFNVKFSGTSIGDVECEVFEEFFRALAFNAGITLHINMMYGQNNHHMIEAVFKAFARALKAAVLKNENIKGIMSTKGIL